ncbi:MAG: D-alanyl-D-alanine carboxypeptidase [Lachnospiraceae bacterium]|nr:D-alanyl-D-alanine carboxypeptidase [Lachnospiraceae bacterium]
MLKQKKLKKIILSALSMWICLTAVFSSCRAVPVFADEVEAGEEAAGEQEEAPEEQEEPAASPEEPADWPKGPWVEAESAILMEAGSGVILYSKNIDEIHYPASTTKVLTCLLAAENCSLDEMVSFSREAVFGIDPGSSNVGMDVGQEITMEEALYCIMLASANEVASAVAEHVAGSVEAFAEMMNERAKELGCTNTHFVNANGLPNEEHYTTAHDLALIAAAFDKNEVLHRIASTVRYDIRPSAKQPDEFTMVNHHKMYKGQKYAYDYITWGKTGYTNVARETLVTCAQRDGLSLVCVIMKDEPPCQYTDTHDLFEYGFANFKKIYIAEHETNYRITNSDFFESDSDIFGSTHPLLELNPRGYAVIPKTAEFEDLHSEIDYDDPDVLEDPVSIARINYDYSGVYVGSTTVDIYSDAKAFEFGSEFVSENAVEYEGEGTGKRSSGGTIDENSEGVVFINVRTLIIIAICFIVAVILFFVVFALIRNYRNSWHRRNRIRKKTRRYFSEFDDFDF